MMNEEAPRKAIKTVLEQRCGKNWEVYLANFVDHEVMDSDLKYLTDEDWRELIPKIGPRNRFKKWAEGL